MALLRVSGELDLGTIAGLVSAVENRMTPGARIVLDLWGQLVPATAR